MPTLPPFRARDRHALHTGACACACTCQNGTRGLCARQGRAAVAPKKCVQAHDKIPCKSGLKERRGNGMGWVGMGWDGLRWVEMGWVGMGWDGLRWVGMGWDGLGWVGMG
eukprot:5220-Chlamydomonas_euryale.AAC.1